MPADQPLRTPFQNIALSLSGGGFRAASFSLGTLSYLKHLKLDMETDDSMLDHVTFISSASGGTITAAVYSMLRHKGASFGTIYQTLIGALNGEALLNKALEKLADDSQWGQPGNYKTRNLINAFSKAYDEMLFGHETFGLYWDTAGRQGLEVCFNATEFERGLPFRFQTDGSAGTPELIGNYFIHFDNNQDCYKHIKLGDILASSSCFPSGFEPMVFPEDFSYRSATASLTPEQLRTGMIYENYGLSKGPLKPGGIIGLMDGGITDNQGLDSAILADNRKRKKGAGFDLVIVTDVASYYMSPYIVPSDKEGPAWKKKTINDYMAKLHKVPVALRWALIICLLVLGAGLYLFFGTNNTTANNTGLLLTGFSSCLLVFIGIIHWLKKRSGLQDLLNPERPVDLDAFIKQKVPALNNFSEPVINKLLAYFRSTPLGVLRQMMLTRLTSVISMVSDINLKHVRRLIYRDFYNNEKWKNRQCGNFIYELSKQNAAARTKYLKEEKGLTSEDRELLMPSAAILEVAEEARLVGTTLWFDSKNKNKLRSVIACGQFSTCVNLLKYVLILEKDTTLLLSDKDKALLADVKGRLKEHWSILKENPHFLYELYEQGR